MSEPITDAAFAAYAQERGLATAAQIEAARARQAEQARAGAPIPLAEALVVVGVITPAQRETAEQRIRDRARGGPARLLHYRLVRKLGEGGMGAVYLAEDTKQGRWVALKILPRQHAENPEFLRRFQREADAMGRLHHEHIVRAFSVGEDQGRHFYVMEYCEGETLDRRLERETCLPPRQAVALVAQVARGLQYAHARGFVHRDIKPANILVTKEGIAKILDLGLTKHVEGAQSTFLTQSGVAMGTPHYIAPEQARGDRKLDGRADIYSLGATFYHLVTGDTPFHGASAYEVVTKHLSEQLPDPRDIRPGVPEGVAHVIRRMMAKRREDRYRDCTELLEDLDRVASGRAPVSRPIDAALSSVAMPGRRRTPSRRRPILPSANPSVPAPPVPSVRLGCFVVTRRAAYGIGLAALAAIVPLVVLSGRVGTELETQAPADSGRNLAIAQNGGSRAEPASVRKSESGTQAADAAPAQERQPPRIARRATSEARDQMADGLRPGRAGIEAGGGAASAGEGADRAPLALLREAEKKLADAAKPRDIGAAPPPAAAKAAAAPSPATDLLARADPARHAVRGAWARTEEGHLACEDVGAEARIEVPFDAGEAYDLHVVFCPGTADEVRLHFGIGGRVADLVLRLRNDPAAVLRPVEGVSGGRTGRLAAPLTPDRNHAVAVQVRPERVSVIVNGAPGVAWRSDDGTLGRERTNDDREAGFAISLPSGAMIIRTWSVTSR